MAYSSISLELVSPLSLVDEPTSDAEPIVQPGLPPAPAGGYYGWLQEKNRTEGKVDNAESRREYQEEHQPWCAPDGELNLEIELPMPDGETPGEIKASYGTLSGGSKKTSERNISKPVSHAESINLGVAIVGKLSASWEGPVIAEDGTTLSTPPAISVDGAVISWGVKATGTLRLRYTEESLSYTIKLPPRTGLPEGASKEDAYKSTIYLTDKDGNTTAHDVELPDMSDACIDVEGGGTSGGSGSDEGGCVRLNIEVDPCTGEKLREWTESIPCPDGEE
jgi:hypothetical protein